MKGNNEYNGILKALEAGLIIEKINDSKWKVYIEKKETTPPTNNLVLTKPDLIFNETLQNIDTDGKEIPMAVLKKIVSENGLMISGKRISVLMENFGYSKYQKRQDSNRMYFKKV